ncbi:MAG: LpxD N-terminal domain-containing protein, partial [Pseudomonadota bacterium]
MPVDRRFFIYHGAKSLGELSDLSHSEVRGDPKIRIDGVASSETAEAGALCFFDGRDKEAANISKNASACFVTASAADHLPDGVIPVTTDRPRWAHILAGHALYRLKDWDEAGAAPQIHETARICQGAVIGADAAIGARTVIGPNAVIGPGVQVGHDTQIGPGASLRCALVGNHVNILAGARIGEAGFGVAESPDGAADIPQWGRVIVQDYVTI